MESINRQPSPAPLLGGTRVNAGSSVISQDHVSQNATANRRSSVTVRQSPPYTRVVAMLHCYGNNHPMDRHAFLLLFSTFEVSHLKIFEKIAQLWGIF